MKRLVAAVMAAVFLLAGCAAEAAPKRALRGMLDALRDGKVSKAEKYTRAGSLTLTGDSSRAKKFYSAVFGTIRYVVADTAVDGDKAEIVVTVSMADMEALLAEETMSLLDDALNGRRNAGKAFYTSVTERIRAEDVPYTTNTVTAKLVHTADGWRVDMENSTGFAAAITGGLSELIGY